MNAGQKFMDTIQINGQEYRIESSNTHQKNSPKIINSGNNIPPCNDSDINSINTQIYNPYQTNDPNPTINQYPESQSFLNINYTGNYTLSEIIDHGPYNRFTFNAIFICSITIFIEGFYLSYFNNILPAFQKYYSVSDFMLKFISSIAFLGYSIGCLLNGFLIKKFTRKVIIITSVIIMTLMHLCLSLIRNVIAFTIFRFLTTFFFGIEMIFTVNILTEYLPIKLRGFVLNTIWITWSGGAIFFLLFCKVFIPNLDYDPTKPLEDQDFHKAIFPLFCVELFYIIYLIFLLYDSPRHLILNEDYAEALKILNHYTDNQITEKEIREMGIKLATQGENQFYKSNNQGFKVMFKKRILWFSINMCVIYFFLSFAVYGNYAALPEILSRISSDSENLKKQNLNDLILITLLGSLGNLIAGILVEIKQIGRKHLAMIFLAICIITGILSFAFVSYFSLFIGISNCFISGAFNIHISYSEEIYPTKIRDFAMSFLFSMTRLGGFSTQYIFLGLINVSLFFPIYVFCILCTILIVLFYFLPKDNTDSLDSEIHIHGDESD